LEVQLGGPKNPKPSPGGKSVFIRIIKILSYLILALSIFIHRIIIIIKSPT